MCKCDVHEPGGGGATISRIEHYDSAGHLVGTEYAVRVNGAEYHAADYDSAVRHAMFALAAENPSLWWGCERLLNNTKTEEPFPTLKSLPGGFGGAS